MRSSYKFLTLFVLSFLVFILVLQKNETNSQSRLSNRRIEPKIQRPRQFLKWNECLSNRTKSYFNDPEELWKNVVNEIRKCEELEMKSLPIRKYKNSDEAKYHILPRNELESNVVITLGIGHDTAAEVSLAKDLSNDTYFYGADPMHEINEDIYNKIPNGRYFPFAVGSQSGVSTASVLDKGSYINKSVVHIELVYFLKTILQKSFIDTIWFDAEGAEYGLFPYFYSDSIFDQNNIVLCQFNMEVHKPNANQKKQFHDYFYQLLEDKRYGMFRPVIGNHIRLYVVNFENEKCLKKYPVSN